ncbi:MAG: anti-sigma factor domain-containing protein [Acidimicrobiales bacterium]
MSGPVRPSDDHPLDDLAVYAVDALDDARRQAVDDHLARCDVCRAELAEHHETLAAIAPEEAPPAAVWQRIAAAIDSPAPLEANDPAGSGPAEDAGGGVDGGVAPIRSLAEAATRTRSRQPSRFRLVAAAACLVATAAAGGAFGYLVGSSDDDSEDIASLAQRASDEPGGLLATLADADGRPVARVVADEDGAFMVLEGLEDLPEGRAYQLWSFDGPEPVSLSMLGREGTNTVAFRLPPTITELGISVERTIGESAPTGALQASGSITRGLS